MVCWAAVLSEGAIEGSFAEAAGVEEDRAQEKDSYMRGPDEVLISGEVAMFLCFLRARNAMRFCATRPMVLRQRRLGSAKRWTYVQMQLRNDCTNRW